MSSNPELELRILTGLHAGARERLGVAGAVLGSAPDADFILRDPGMHEKQARLEPGEGGWRLRVWDKASAEASAPVEMHPGAIHSIGPVLIALDAPEAPWPAPAALLAAQTTQAASDLAAGTAPAVGTSTQEAADAQAGQGATLQESTSAPDDASASGATVIATQADTTDPAAGGARADTRLSLMQRSDASLAALSRASGLTPRRVSYAIAAFGVLVTWGIGWAIFGGDRAEMHRSAANPPNSQNAGRTILPAPPVDTQALSAAIKALKLAQPVTLSEDAFGRPIVTTGLVNNDEHERLALALSSFNPRPAIRVTLEQDLIAAVRETVGRQATETGVPLKTEYLGAGRFRLSGHLKTPADRDALLTGLKAAVPALAKLEPALTVPEDLARQLLNDLRNADVAEIQGKWQDDKLQIDAYLAQSSLPRWEQLIGTMGRRYAVPFSATLHFEQPAPTRPTGERPGVKPAKPAAQPAIALPFRLMSVVGGATPYVVLDGGAKLMLDGSRDGWRLVSIDPASVVFEDNKARKVVLPR